MTTIEVYKRVPTGPLQFKSDWPGVFIRGDEALPLADQIEALQLDGHTLPTNGPGAVLLERVIGLLRSCEVKHG